MSLRHLISFGSTAAAALVAATLVGMPSSAAQTTLRLSLDSRLEAPAGLFLLPHDKGYYKAAGVEVTVDEAASTLEAISRVAAGGYEMAFADINALIKYRDQHPAAPIKAVFMVYNKPPYAIVGRKSRGIGEPKQLEGKRLGASTTSATYAQWPLFAKLNGLDLSRVTIETIATPVRAPMLAAGQLDAVLGFSFRVYIDVKDRGVPVDDIVLLPMANYGLKLYGNAIIVNTRFAADKPEAIKAFLNAFLRGLKEAVRRPAEAADSVVRRNDLAKREVELERLQMAIKDNIVTPEVRTHGYGAVMTARIEESIEQIALAHAFKIKPKPDDIFDASYLPPAAERKVN